MICCDICEKELLPEGSSEYYLTIILRKEENFGEQRGVLEADYSVCSNCMKNFKELFKGGNHD